MMKLIVRMLNATRSRRIWNMNLLLGWVKYDDDEKQQSAEHNLLTATINGVSVCAGDGGAVDFPYHASYLLPATRKETEENQDEDDQHNDGLFGLLTR